MSVSEPNIVLINCDDLGYGDLGCYGSTCNKTPYLDKLAAEGIKFTDFYMASAVCTPSRGAMMTGCLPPRIGFSDFEGHKVLFPGSRTGLNPDETSIAEMLKNTGYSTKLIGKWHCGDQPEFLPANHGFDEYFGLPYSNDMGRQENRPDSPPLPLLKDDDVLQEQPDQQALTERYTYEAVDYIRRNKDNKFFLYLAHMYVHVPIYVQRRFLEHAQNGGYGAAVECIDWSTGVIMDELRRLGLDENTLVIFTSDNGSRARDEGGSNAPLRGVKGSTWEGGFRVPCIMRWPGVIEKNRTSNVLMSAIDLYPTLAAIAGGEIPEDRRIDGIDFEALITGDEDTPLRPFFPYYDGRGLAAIRDCQYKLHFYRNGEQIKELYDLQNDVGESENLYDDLPEVAEALEEAASIYRTELGDVYTGIEGRHTRPCGFKEDAQPLTSYDPDHPYMIAMYDRADSKVMAG